jgi:hypothetical protein
MGIMSHGLAVGLGYLLGRPEGRQRLAQVGQQATDLARRPEVAQLRERGKGLAAEQAKVVKEKVLTRARSPRSRAAHFPPSPGITPPASLGGTTVVEDSEAAMLGMDAGAGREAASPGERS